MNSILEEVSVYVSGLLNDNLPDEIGYHDLMHTREVTSSAFEIGSNSGLSEEELQLVQIAAWFHDTGFIVKYKGHEKESIRIAQEFLKKRDMPQEDIDTISQLISITEHPNTPSTLMQKVLKDADILNIGQDVFFTYNERIKEEREQFEKTVFENKEWLESSLKFIRETDFYTDYAQNTYGKKREENIKILTERLNKK